MINSSMPLFPKWTAGESSGEGKGTFRLPPGAGPSARGAVEVSGGLSFFGLPVGIPMIPVQHTAKRGHLFRVTHTPTRPRLLEPLAHHRLAGSFNHPTADRLPLRQPLPITGMPFVRF